MITSLTACTTVTDKSDVRVNANAAQCREVISAAQQLIDQEGVADSQAVRVEGFGYLRSNRLLASFKDQLNEPGQFDAWLDQLQQLGIDGLTIELANLPAQSRALLPQQPVFYACVSTLRQADFAEAAAQQRLIDSVAVPDEYQTWKRIAGLYWLTAWATKYGTEGLYSDIQATYNKPMVTDNLISYRPPTEENYDAAAIMARAYRDQALGIPALTTEDKNRLFAAFAPTIAVETKTDNDRIGRLAWSATNKPTVVITERPTVYRHLSYTRFNQQTLLQLNYSFWFPARPKQSALDYLGGNIDGLIWRVTLSRAGEPIAYDSIHHCGCYHLFFPTQQSCIKPSTALLEEPGFSFQTIQSNSNTPLTLQLAHSSHYLDRVIEQPLTTDTEVEYQWADYKELRSLEKPGTAGRRQSLFQSDGIMAGTERGERFFLWPMGIPAPGEMRQWGHHATAFYGRRHFDDADIIERYIGLNDKTVCQ
ncbi:hypothetical protein [Oceanicoccus sagamiensis]|uniref:hypothetical protein n=1 Tax=Oceanicoccus sagamiensis TaxID=716816 RepID=UPI0012F4E67F|nr:hypothetical protein [Oceanicoccus sagamiensis]